MWTVCAIRSCLLQIELPRQEPISTSASSRAVHVLHTCRKRCLVLLQACSCDVYLRRPYVFCLQVPPPVKSRKRARQIVTSFHKLTKQAEAASGSTSQDSQVRLQQLHRNLDRMGGRQAYQSASQLSASFHNTSKWVTQQLTRLGMRPGRGQPPLKLLEVRPLLFEIRSEDRSRRHAALSLENFNSLLCVSARFKRGR